MRAIFLCLFLSVAVTADYACLCQASVRVVFESVSEDVVDAGVTITGACRGDVGICDCFGVPVPCSGDIDDVAQAVVTETNVTDFLVCAGITTTPVISTLCYAEGSTPDDPACVGSNGTVATVAYDYFQTSAIAGDRLVIDTVCSVDRTYRTCAGVGPCVTDPVDCVTEAIIFGPCNATCGTTGFTSAPVVILTNASNGGVACPVGPFVYEACEAQPCPVHCEMSEWATATPCAAANCGDTGTLVQRRSITQLESFGGDPCAGNLVVELPCVMNTSCVDTTPPTIVDVSYVISNGTRTIRVVFSEIVVVNPLYLYEVGDTTGWQIEDSVPHFLEKPFDSSFAMGTLTQDENVIEFEVESYTDLVTGPAVASQYDANWFITFGWPWSNTTDLAGNLLAPRYFIPIRDAAPPFVTSVAINASDATRVVVSVSETVTFRDVYVDGVAPANVTAATQRAVFVSEDVYVLNFAEPLVINATTTITGVAVDLAGNPTPFEVNLSPTWVNVTMSRSGLTAVYMSGPSLNNVLTVARGYRIITSGFVPGEPGPRNQYAVLVDSVGEIPLLEPSTSPVTFAGSFVGSTLRYRTGWTDGSVVAAILAGPASAVWLPVIDALEPYILRTTVSLTSNLVGVLWSEPMYNADGFVRFSNGTETAPIAGVQFGPDRYVYALLPSYMIAGAQLRFEGMAMDNSSLRNRPAAISANRVSIASNTTAFDDRDTYVRHENIANASRAGIITYRFNRPINVASACSNYASFSFEPALGGPTIYPSSCVATAREPLEEAMGEADSITFSFADEEAVIPSSGYLAVWSGFTITSWAGDVLSAGAGYPGDGGTAIYNWMYPSVLRAEAVHGTSVVRVFFSQEVTLTADMALNGAPNNGSLSFIHLDGLEWELTFPLNITAPDVYTLLVPSDSVRSTVGQIHPPFTVTLPVTLVDAEVAVIDAAERVDSDTILVTMNQPIFWADATRTLELGRQAFNIWTETGAVEIYSAEIIDDTVVELTVTNQPGWYHYIDVSTSGGAFVTITGTPVVAAGSGVGVSDWTTPRVTHAMVCQPLLVCVVADRTFFFGEASFPGNEPDAVVQVDSYSLTLAFNNVTSNGTIEGTFGEGSPVVLDVQITASAFTEASINWTTGVATLVWPNASPQPGRFRAKFPGHQWWAKSTSSSCVDHLCTVAFDLRRGDGGVLLVCHVFSGACGLAIVVGRDAPLAVVRLVYDNYTSSVTVFANRPISTPMAGAGVTIGNHESFESHVYFEFTGAGNVTMLGGDDDDDSLVISVPPAVDPYFAFPGLQSINTRRSGDDSAFATVLDLEFDDCIKNVGYMGSGFRSVAILPWTGGQIVRIVGDPYVWPADGLVTPSWEGFVFVPCTGATAAFLSDFGVFDTAEPAAQVAYTRDVNRDGVVDAIDVVFSEPITFPLGVQGIELTDPAFEISEAVALNSTVVRLAVTNAGNEFPATFTLYAIPAVCDLVEPAPNCMTTNRHVPLFDGAPAVVESAVISLRDSFVEITFSDDDWEVGGVPSVSLPDMTVGALARSNTPNKGVARTSRNLTNPDIVDLGDATLSFGDDTVSLSILLTDGDSPEVMLVTAVDGGVAVYFTMPVTGTGAGCFTLGGVLLGAANMSNANSSPFRIFYPDENSASLASLNGTDTCDLVGVINGNAAVVDAGDYNTLDRIQPVPVAATIVALESAVQIEFSEPLSSMDLDIFRQTVSGVDLGTLPSLSIDRRVATVPLAAAFTDNELVPVFQTGTVNTTVFDANGNAAVSHTEPILITDPAKMRITNALTRDADQDGVIDTVFVFASSAIDKGSVRNDSNTRHAFTVTGFVVTGISNASADNAFVIHVVPTVDGDTGTAVRPTVQIGSGGGPTTPSSITIRSQTSGAFARAMSNDAFVSRDGAGPILKTAYGEPGSRIVVVELSEALAGGIWATFPGIAFAYIDAGAARISSQPAATIEQTDSYVRVAFYLTEPASVGNATVRINGPYVSDAAGNRAASRTVDVMPSLSAGGSSGDLTDAQLGAIIGGSIAGALVLSAVGYVLYVRGFFGRFSPARHAFD